MDFDHCPIPDSPAAPNSFVRRVAARLPFLCRRSGRIGLQAKVVVCFMALLSVALGVSAWTFAHQSNARLADILGEQARQLSHALSLASRTPIENDQWPALRQIGDDMLKSRNVLYVSFFDADLRPVVVTSRDPEFQADPDNLYGQNVVDLMQVRQLWSEAFGDYVEVTAPVLTMTAPVLTMTAPVLTMTTPVLTKTAPASSIAGSRSRLLGYVSIGVTQAQEQAQMQRLNVVVVGIGAVIGLMILPVASMLVHRIFLPIRQLVVATDRIARGELDAKVAIHRPDVIGTLARSFNEMVLRVKQEQDALEEKVRVRTAEIERASHRLRREIAEKEDFLRAVSHDLSAPLRNISGMASMLLMKHRATFDADVIHRLERIQKNVEVETDLIMELLELSRIKTRRLKIEPVDLHALVEDLRGVFEQDLQSRQITLAIENPLPVVLGERARLRQVFQNLIDNAIKYMGDGPEHRITIASHPGPDGHEFSITDTGIGIEPDDLDKVFFIFRRGRSQSVQNVAGKGVGLASVKSIIDTYGGSISVQSRPGVGTTFRFSINNQKVIPEEHTRATAA